MVVESKDPPQIFKLEIMFFYYIITGDQICQTNDHFAEQKKKKNNL